MTIFYIDPINGNDASSGVDWANAWKTFASGPTAARIAPGDEMRVAKSPDPTTVGTATWTNRKVGNSITFDTAPTKQIDTCKTGWVTMGAGSTVTNAQSTAYMMWGTTPGTGAALQVATSASANGAYKALGSTVDFSAYQQVSFWFRTTSTFDCTGAQNLNIRFCSDTAGATPVDTLVAPKWNYAANTWYPIVIDKGSALGSTIQSVSCNTTNTTTQTFYFDEMFASPANGLTLWSLIEDNTETWYPIRTIRDANVWLHSGISSGTAAGATGSASAVDASWVGTTATFSTRKRETMKAYASTGPANITWGQANEAGTWTAGVKQLNKYRFGFDTTSNTQSGDTYIENLTQLGTCFNSSVASWRYENLVAVRFGVGLNFSGASTSEYNNIGAIGCSTTAISLGQPVNLTVWPTADRTYNLLSITANNAGSSMAFGTANYSASGLTMNCKSIWGNQGNFLPSYITDSTITIDTISSYGNGNTAPGVFNNLTQNNITIARAESPFTTSSAPNAVAMAAGVLQFNGSTANIVGITEVFGSGLNYQHASDILSVGTFGGTSAPLVTFTVGLSDSLVVSCTSNNSSATGPFKWLAAGSSNNSKLAIQNFNGNGTAALITGSGSLSFLGQFELQTGDVYTGGSKAWKYTTSGLATQVLFCTQSIKLASVAAAANKLVTITCYVKKSAEYQDVGIRVPAIFLPGYSSNISTSFSGTVGTWQQLTITFTPTDECVFDLLGFVDYSSILGLTDAVWDTLSVTQAA